MENFNFRPDLIWFAILGVIVIMSIIYVYRLEKSPNNTIYFIDLITINGKVNERKFCRLGAWAVSTWGFVYLISIDKLDEWYFLGYIGAWVSNALLDKYIPNPKNNEPGGAAFTNQQDEQPS